MIRFLADSSLNHAIVSGCGRPEPSMDFLSAVEAGLEGLPIPTSWADAQKRILVAHDFQTMPRYFGVFLEANESSPGVLLVPRSLPIAEAIDDLILI